MKFWETSANRSGTLERIYKPLNWLNFRNVLNVAYEKTTFWKTFKKAMRCRILQNSLESWCGLELEQTWKMTLQLLISKWKDILFLLQPGMCNPFARSAGIFCCSRERVVWNWTCMIFGDLDELVLPKASPNVGSSAIQKGARDRPAAAQDFWGPNF